MVITNIAFGKLILFFPPYKGIKIFLGLFEIECGTKMFAFIHVLRILSQYKGI